jgi:fatty-acyl-CoA synthase
MQSYARGMAVPPIEKTIDQLLAGAAARHPEGEAIVSRHQRLRLSWRELEEQAARTAAGLWGLGLRPGDRVGMWSTSCAEWVYLQAATARIGAVLVNLNPAYRSHELRYVLARSRMKALFLHERDARADYVAILEEASRGQRLALEHTVLLETESWRRMIAGGAEPGAVETSPGDVVNIQYTSGTTGAPKGCLLTHRNLVNNAWLMGRELHIAERDRIAVPVPLYHCFGCVVGSLLSLNFGAAMVLPAATFDPLATLEAIEQERCTAVYGVPTMFLAQLERPEFGKFDLTSLRTGLMAGAPCPIELMKRVVTRMHCPEMTIAYGQTETSPCITMSSGDDDLEKRTETIGRPLPNTEVKIVALDGSTVEVGEPGELCTRGYLVMQGYDGDAQATAQAIDREGWLRTGDLAVMRADGYFRIAGRAREMIIRGGENIYPREIEDFLLTHPEVAEVAVAGVPDARLGETVAAWIRLRAGAAAGEEEIREFCAGRLAHFKAPEYIRFVDAFPMTASGKVQKYRIREFEIEARGLSQAARIRTA